MDSSTKWRRIRVQHSELGFDTSKWRRIRLSLTSNQSSTLFHSPPSSSASSEETFLVIGKLINSLGVVQDQSSLSRTQTSMSCAIGHQMRSLVDWSLLKHVKKKNSQGWT